MNGDWGTDPDLDDTTRSLLGALRLLAGDIEAAETILDALPAVPFTLDHGAGYCLVAPFEALAFVLPVPEPLGDSRTWTRGSPVEHSLRDWLRENSGHLMWDEESATYQL